MGPHRENRQRAIESLLHAPLQGAQAGCQAKEVVTLGAALFSKSRLILPKNGALGQGTKDSSRFLREEFLVQL